MSLLNIVVLRGNITAKPELSYTPKGTAKAIFTLALNEKYKDNEGQPTEKAHFFHVTTWKKIAEACAEKLVKGQEVILQGKLCFDSWKDAEGVKKSRVYVNASTVVLIPFESI